MDYAEQSFDFQGQILSVLLLRSFIIYKNEYNCI